MTKQLKILKEKENLIINFNNLIPEISEKLNYLKIMLNEESNIWNRNLQFLQLFNSDMEKILILLKKYIK